MRAARSKRQIKQRVDYYLWEARSPPLLKLRKIIQDHFCSLGRVAVIGGLIRDLAQVGAAGFKSDIDLVIDEDHARVEAFARSVQAVQNKFGGYRYSTPSWNIDFWALETTWASSKGYVDVKDMRDLLRCTFFTTDALVYLVDSRTLLYRDDCLNDLLSGRLEVNLLHNPSPYGNLIRAVRRTLMRNMAVGPKLYSFVDSNLDKNAFDYIVATEHRLYGSSLASEFRDFEDLKEEFARRREKVERDPQLSLPLPSIRTSSEYLQSMSAAA